MNPAMRILPVALAAGLLAAQAARAEDQYNEGHVWIVTMVKVKYGMLDNYLNEVMPLRKKIEDEARKEGLLLSSHILRGFAANRDDYDVLLMQEFKNYAAFDGIKAKTDAIEEKVIGSLDKQNQILAKRVEVREVLGIKTMQELLPK